MNKRQNKKRSKIQWERLNFVSLYYISFGRQNGKTQFQKNVAKMCIQKQHRPFKDFKKWVLKQQKLNPAQN